MALDSILRDPAPLDVAISACFLATIGVLLITCLRRGAPTSDRAWWTGLTLVVSVLLVNQQTDLHSSALSTARRVVRSLAIDSNGLPVATFKTICFVLLFSAVAVAICGGAGGDDPPRRLARLGVILLFLHAAGRGAAFIGVIPTELASGGLHHALQALEVGGLLVIALSALRYHPARATALAGRPYAALRKA